MMRGYKNTFWSAVLIGNAAFTSPARADNVWDYARERAQRQPALETPTKPQAVKEMIPSDPQITPPARKHPFKSNVEPHKPSAPKKSRPAFAKKPPTPALVPAPTPALKPEPSNPSTQAPALTFPVASPKPQPAPVQIKARQVATMDEKHAHTSAVHFAKWLRELVDLLKGTPDEAQLRRDFIQLNRESKEQNTALSASHEKLAAQQKILQMLQRKLKEAQSPALPQEESRREVFAAGMAAGYGLLDLIETRKAMGIDLPKEDFMAGVQEAMNNGRRLSQDEFKTLLNTITAKVNVAEQKIEKLREKKDSEWKTAFSLEKGSVQSEEGIWYQIRYPGDRQITDAELMTLSLNRQLTDGTVLEDSDTSDNKLRIRKENSLPLLKDILNALKLHGQVRIAMPVDNNGTPYLTGPFYEIWDIRISDADAASNGDSNNQPQP
jgi:Domain amino terminal to FKBP-type peptidyl-prolyl isomerase.